MKLKIKATIAELRKECEDRNLPTGGTEKELKDRIKKYDSVAKSDLFRASGLANEKKEEAFLGLSENRFLVQVKLANISMYFVHGCLYPVNLEESIIYKEQNRKADLLTQFPDYIPLAKGVISDFDETHAIIEVILSIDEVRNVLTVGNIYLLDCPLPISRVTAIYFANNSVRNSFLSSTAVFSDAYVPRDICQIIPEQIATEKLSIFQPPIRASERWKSIINRYDRLLGMIAFLKNTTLFYANATNEYLEYTPGYFQVLSLINNPGEAPPKENSFFGWIISPESIKTDRLARFQFKEIIRAIYDGYEFDVDWGLQLIENCMMFEKGNEILDQLISIQKLLLEYKKMRIDYRTILSSSIVQKNIPILILIFLIKFPNKALGHSDKQAFKNYFRTNECAIERNHAEFIFAVLGLYYGYSNLVKEDHFEMNDSYFNKLARENGSIKFKLDSFLDRFAIESIFEFSKRNGENPKASFEFLEIFKTPIQGRLQMPRTSDAEYIDESFIKYGKQILSVRRISANMMLAREVNELYGAHITQSDYIFAYVAKYHPELLSIKKETLVQLIAENSGLRTLTELKDSVELDKKYSRSKLRR